MKKSLKLLFCATALASLAGCNKFDEADTAPDSGNGSLIKVYAKVAENDGTRANIHVGESAFTAEWEAGDALGILPVKTGGTARRQSPTGTGEGPEVTFSAQTLDATTPRTCHIITYDAKNAGSATLTITLGDSYTDTRTLDCEVNEGAIDDTEKK